MNMPAPATALASPAPLQTSAPEYLDIALDDILFSRTPLQVLRRERFTKESLAELTADIKTRGVLEPILVRPAPSKVIGGCHYELIFGERRLLASRAAGLATIPALVRAMTDVEAIGAQFAENMEREGLHELEEAEGYRLLCQAHKCDAKALVTRGVVAKNEAHVYARMKLLDLCSEVRADFYAGKLNASIALLISRIRDPKGQQRALRGCLTGIGLGNFGGVHYDGALIFDDAKRYIHEEFIVYQEGAAAVEAAKKKGLPAKGISETKDLWKRSYAPPAGHILVDDVKDKIGAEPAGAVLMQNPHTGEARLVLRKDKAIEAFKAKKIALPSGLKPRPNYMGTSSGASAAAAKPDSAATAKKIADLEKQERQEQLKIDIQIATFKAVRAKYPAKFGKPELLLLLDLDYHPHCDHAPKRPKSLTGCTEKDLVGFALDNLLTEDLGDGDYDREDELRDAAKRYGVNSAAIAKDLTEDFEEKEAELAAAAKKETAAPAAGTWPPAGMKILGSGAIGNHFTAKLTPSPELAAIVGTAPLTRVDVTKKIWSYIKKQKLQDTHNKRQIFPDAKLGPVMQRRVVVTLFDMTKLIANHLAAPAGGSTAKQPAKKKAAKK